MKYTAAQLKQISNAKKNLVEIKTDTNFLQLPKKLFGTGLNSDQIIILAHIYETIQISWNNDDNFYDKKRHAYYAVVNRKDVANMINTTPNTVGTVIQELCDIGYISKVQTWNKGLKIFVRHFSKGKENKKSQFSKMKNSESNETQPNDTHATNDTKDTARVENLNTDDKIKKMIEDGIQSGVNKVLGKSKQNEPKNEDNFEDGQDDKHLNYVVSNTGSMPQKAIKSIGIMADNLYKSPKKKRKFIFDINGLVFKHKHRVAEDNGLLNSFYWEKDNLLLTKFNASIYEFLYNAFSGKRKVDNGFAYFAGSLKKLFKGIADEELGRTPKKSKQQNHGKKRIKEHVPESYINKPDYKEISSNRKAELEAKLAQIK